MTPLRLFISSVQSEFVQERAVRPTVARQKVRMAQMDAEIAALERRWDKTCAIKQGMMQQLLTGRVRLGKSA